MDLDFLQEGRGSPLFRLGLVAGLGLLFAVLGISLFFRARKGKNAAKAPSRLANAILNLASLLFLAAGIALDCVAGFAYLKHPQVFTAAAAAANDQENPEELVSLKTAKLEAASPTASSNNDWPQWRGPNRDGISHETGLRKDWDEVPPRILWKRPIGGGYSCPSVVGNRIYTMDKKDQNEEVLCLDADTGKEIWTYPYPVERYQFSYSGGPRATPTVFDNRIYSVGGSGIFLCLEMPASGETPKVLWQHNLLTEFDAPLPGWGVACSPLIEGDLVVVQPGGKKGSIVAFDRRTGQVAWSALSDTPGYSSPIAALAAGVRQIICFAGKGITGVRAADGGQLWSFPWSTSNDANIATPIVVGDYVFLSSDYNAGCALLHLLPEGTGGVKAEPVYVKRGKLMRNHHSTSVVHDGFLYGFDRDTLKCVDLRTAEEKWAARGLAKGSLIYADGQLIVLTENGTLAFVEASPNAYRKLGQVKDILKGSETWTAPVLVSGRLFLRDQETIMMLALNK